MVVGVNILFLSLCEQLGTQLYNLPKRSTNAQTMVCGELG